MHAVTADQASAPARARGRFGGRPKKLADAQQLALARALYDGGQTDIDTICPMLGTSRATLYRALKPRHQPQPTPATTRDAP